MDRIEINYGLNKSSFPVYLLLLPAASWPMSAVGWLPPRKRTTNWLVFLRKPFSNRADHRGQRIFHFMVATGNPRLLCRKKLPHLTALMFVGILSTVTRPSPPAAGFLVDSPQSKTSPSEPPKAATDHDVKPEHRLLADLESALTAYADHADYLRLDRELAAAFRTYGLDLDVVDRKAAGAKLAGRPSTPEVAAAIDRWCRTCKTLLKVPTCAGSSKSPGPPIPTPAQWVARSIRSTAR